MSNLSSLARETLGSNHTHTRHGSITESARDCARERRQSQHRESALPLLSPPAMLPHLERRADRTRFSSFSRRQLPGATEGYTQATFCILEEDHTLGNLLRWMLMKKCVAPRQHRLLPDAFRLTLSSSPCSPSVEFCGYRYVAVSRRRCGSDPDPRSCSS